MVIIASYVETNLVSFDVIEEFKTKICFSLYRESSKAEIGVITYDSYEHGHEEVIFHFLKENVNVYEYIVEEFGYEFENVIDLIQDERLKRELINMFPEMVV